MESHQTAPWQRRTAFMVSNLITVVVELVSAKTVSTRKTVFFQSLILSKHIVWLNIFSFIPIHDIPLATWKKGKKSVFNINTWLFGKKELLLYSGFCPHFIMFRYSLMSGCIMGEALGTLEHMFPNTQGALSTALAGVISDKEVTHTEVSHSMCGSHSL